MIKERTIWECLQGPLLSADPPKGLQDGSQTALGVLLWSRAGAPTLGFVSLQLSPSRMEFPRIPCIVCKFLKELVLCLEEQLLPPCPGLEMGLWG